MTKLAISEFIVFCAEEYRAENELSGSELFHLFENNGVFKYLTDNYDLLHTFGRDYIVDTIDEFIKNKCYCSTD
ncbi:MAG: DUF3791 domain-containing protein [Clostridiales Family XIII bacterium]|jgi:hypothetical protein|nr:DUF3791 domain-containing protein [Clostridiales Family XIII bacterium]